MSEQYVDVDMGHEYDGIREFDNRLPNWWLMTLWGAIVFAFAYWVYYHTTETGPSAAQAFAADWKAHEDAVAEYEKNNVVTGDKLLAMAKDSALVQSGKAAYDANCAACHRADGGGGIGPNLTDDAWIHGGTPENIYKTVADGVLAKGMPAWKPVLGEVKVREVVAYLLTLKGTNVADGKAAQGPGAAAAAPAGDKPADAKPAADVPKVTDEELLALSKDPAAVEAGKKLWTTNCVACHKADGGGSIGPNLTDNAWIHGGAPSAIHKTVTVGVIEKGMSAWGGIIGADGVNNVVAYVLTMKNTNVAGGKEAQGTVEGAAPAGDKPADDKPADEASK